MATTLFEKKVHPMVSVPDAIRTVLRHTALRIVSEGIETETVAIPLTPNVANGNYALLGRRLSHDIIMSEPGYPDYNASIMDGYAIRSSDKFTSRGEEQLTHVVVDKVFAGDGLSSSTHPESRTDLPFAYYITTGAVVPKSCDCVVPIEECKVSDDNNRISIHPTATIKAGTWIRPVGCDIAAGTVVLPKGHIMDPVAIGLLIQSRIPSVTLQRQIRVGVLSTGNELIGPIDQGYVHGKIPDVNRPILLSLLYSFGTCIPIDLGIERDDDLESLTQTLRAAMDNGCDVILTTGGISMGESDALEQVLVQKLGSTLHIGRMHMKPGKPTTFVTVLHKGKTRLVFAMPGNPVSATVCTQLLVRPCLQLLRDAPDLNDNVHGESADEIAHRMVQHAWVHPEVTAKLSHNVKLDIERPEYHRVTLKTESNGNQLIATSTGVQQSSRLLSLRDAEGLLVLPQGAGNRMVASEGDEFTALLLNGGRGVQVSKSQHLTLKPKKSLQIDVIHVVDPLIELSGHVASLKDITAVAQSALSGSTSGSADVVSSTSFSGDAGQLFDFCTARIGPDSMIDIVVVVSRSSFRYHLDVANSLRQRLAKVADSLALQARRGVASVHAASALFETVVGYVPEGRGSMMILLPEVGFQGGLENVRGLLKHALYVGRGTP